jgi:hypothetical protein
VALALIVANEHHAGFEPAPGRTACSREAVQEPATVAIKTAEGTFLDVPGDHATEQARAQARRRRAAENRSPRPSKPIRGERVDASDLDRDRGRVCYRLARG